MKILWEDIKKDNSTQLVKYFLMSCYLYYIQDVNVLTDSEFDEMCKIILKDYDKIIHMHKSLISKEDLKASTGFQIKYPTIIKHLSIKWYNEYVEYVNEQKRNNK